MRPNGSINTEWAKILFCLGKSPFIQKLSFVINIPFENVFL